MKNKEYIKNKDYIKKSGIKEELKRWNSNGEYYDNVTKALNNLLLKK